MKTKPTPIFHITHKNNLEKIINSKGLHCVSSLSSKSNSYTNIAHNSIQDLRATTVVPVDPFGTLHEYVPFYFAPRSPMLYTIHRGNVTGYSDGQKPIVYLVTTIEEIEKQSIPFCFTDGHGIMYFTNYYKELTFLNQIDWEVMKMKYWSDTPEDNDRKRRRQAEFLIHSFLPLNSIKAICVINNSIKDDINKLLEIHNVTNIPVLVKDDWYY
ncbi:DUF4433 domain-containing protein [Bacillus idriensis]|uniref:DUF4433 domain-containing protein n=1 Tax=Metabacillus idriensis TaxID=324768 RepID=A0A6I2MEG9_9BACI|nr:DUF4433 domain-containing protein [Metabacillus idriensis]MRX56730.1 DUF4433 domain-containing protein [Metabacillus idriensis]